MFELGEEVVAEFGKEEMTNLRTAERPLGNSMEEEKCSRERW